MMRFVFEKYCSTSTEKGVPQFAEVVRTVVQGADNETLNIRWWFQRWNQWGLMINWVHVDGGRVSQMPEGSLWDFTVLSSKLSLGSLGWIEQLFWKYAWMYLRLAAVWKGTDKCLWDCFILFFRIAHYVMWFYFSEFVGSFVFCPSVYLLQLPGKRGDRLFQKCKPKPKTFPPH